MVARSPIVIGATGLFQQLQSTDTLLGVQSNSTALISGKASLALSSPVQKITVTDARLTVAMNVMVTPIFPAAYLRGIVIECTLLRQSAGSFDVMLVQKYIDGKPLSSQAANNLFTLNYYGV